MKRSIKFQAINCAKKVSGKLSFEITSFADGALAPTRRQQTKRLQDTIRTKIHNALVAVGFEPFEIKV